MLKKKLKLRKPRIIITPYKIGSESCRLLQQRLQELVPSHVVLRVRKDSSKYLRRPSDFVIAWGNCSGTPWVDQQQEAAKAIAANKLKTFNVFKEKGVPHPEWTTDWNEAFHWFEDGVLVVGRTTLTGHSGEGILLYDADAAIGEDQFDEGRFCKMYVKYKKKKHEYRVHVFNGEVLDVVQKKKRSGDENVNYQIRNHANGWVFCRENIQEPADLRQVAMAACSALGLMYGAVDIIWNEKENKCYALEVNTAPGIEGTTLEKYAYKFVEILNE